MPPINYTRAEITADEYETATILHADLERLYEHKYGVRA